jgi:predicted lipoprotein with Yx(FWY)xxD motif
MTRKRPNGFLDRAAVAPLVAIAIAGCGGATASPAPTKTADGRAATVAAATTDLGKTLVDSKGRTLYLFERDAGTRSSCAGACAASWPPLRAKGKPTVGTGVSAALIGTATRSDGAPQVTYNGHPLYLYVEDRKPSDTNGQGVTAFGSAWYALSPAGHQLSGQPASSGGGLDSDGDGY